jgi:hypothetical protein
VQGLLDIWGSIEVPIWSNNGPRLRDGRDQFIKESFENESYQKTGEKAPHEIALFGHQIKAKLRCLEYNVLELNWGHIYKQKDP